MEKNSLKKIWKFIFAVLSLTNRLIKKLFVFKAFIE